MIPIIWVVGMPFLAAFLLLILRPLAARLHIGWYVLICPLILFVSLIRRIPAIADGKTYTETIQWVPSFHIHFSAHLDGLSLLFALLITGIGTLVVLYSIYYMQRESSLALFYVYLLLFMGAMLGVVFSDHMLLLYSFWELTSIASFLLIAFWYHRKRSRYGAQKSLLITVFGGICMLIAFLMMYHVTGTFSIQETIRQAGELKGHPLFIPVMLLLLLGAFTKSAQFPFHIWLPDAMEAPTPVSSYLHSATMVKAGIFLVARFTPVFAGGPVWFWAITGTGLLTMLWGSFIAMRQRDLKALLAYSTISQLGLIMSLFGIGSSALYHGEEGIAGFAGMALFAALFHLVNHSTFKGALFMVVGMVDLGVGTRDIRRLGGLGPFMPVTFAIALISGFSMAGLPPFNGFLSKEMFFAETFNAMKLNIFSLGTWGVLLPAVAVVGGILTFAYSMILVFDTFFGTYQPERLEREAKEPEFGMLVAPGILAVLILALFIWPNVLSDYVIYPALLSMLPGLPKENPLHIAHWHGLSPELLMTVIAVGLGIVLYLCRKQWKKVYQLLPDGWTIDALYRKSLLWLETVSNRGTTRYMTGSTTDYLVYLFTVFALLLGPMLVINGGFQIDFSRDAPLEVFEVIMTLVMVVAAFAIIFAKNRLTAIILNGVLGYSISFMFVLFRAPDLALTQLVVETATTTLFLACFYFLPELKLEKETQDKGKSKLLISIIAGLVFTVTALAVKSFRRFESISSYFENSDQLTGGENIVNAILGDFRAFDTMLETIVLFMAGLGVYALIRSTRKKEF